MKKLPASAPRSRQAKPLSPGEAPECQKEPPAPRMDRQAQTLLGRRLDRVFGSHCEERLPDSLGTLLADVEKRLKSWPPP